MSARITTAYGADTTCLEVISGVDHSGRRAIVTGASSGLGIETARALAVGGAEVTLAVRNTAVGERIAQDISAAAGGRPLYVTQLDLTDQDSVAALVDAWDGPLNILVANAGVMAPPETRATEGWELQFATNHLGHFALATGLRSALAREPGSSVVLVSSSAHLQSPVHFDDIHFQMRPDNPWTAYAQSKTANVLFAVGATRRWATDGVTANALHPGGILTNLSRHMDPDLLERLKEGDTVSLKTPRQGAATSVLLAASPLLEGIGGRYFEDCNEAEPASDGAFQAGEGGRGVAARALDPGGGQVALDGQPRRHPAPLTHIVRTPDSRCLGQTWSDQLRSALLSTTSRRRPASRSGSWRSRFRHSPCCSR